MILQPIAMIRPNKDFIYAPSRIREPVEKDITKMRAGQVKVSMAEDGVSNPQMITAYANGLDCWYISILKEVMLRD